MIHLTTALLCVPTIAPTTGQDPTAALFAVLAERDVVLLGESPHRGRRIHDLYSRVVAHPDFATSVDDVLVEFGNARHQAIMDRYVLELEDVPSAELARTWRDTTQLLVWDSPVYEAFFTTVRERNADLAREERVRVLLGDPPIDWAQVRTAQELEPWLDRESSYVDVLEREVLAKDRKALVLIGSAHCMKRTAREGFAAETTDRSWLGHLLASDHPGRAFSVYSFFGKLRLSGYEGVDGWTEPTWIDLASNPVGEASFGLVAPRLAVQREVDGETRWVPLEPQDWPPMPVMADALLYVGEEAQDEEVPPLPETYEDEAYTRELLRRAHLLDELFQFDSYVPQLRQLLGEESR